MSNRRPDDATSLRFREYLPTLDTFYAERTEQLRRDAQQKKLELLQRAEQKKAELEQFAERERTERRRTLDPMLEDAADQTPPPAAAAALASRHASLTNLRVAFTGTLQLTRREAEALACAAGANVPRQASSRCDVLVAGVRPGNKKLEAARRSGAEVWTEEEFIGMARRQQESNAAPGSTQGEE